MFNTSEFGRHVRVVVRVARKEDVEIAGILKNPKANFESERGGTALLGFDLHGLAIRVFLRQSLYGIANILLHAVVVKVFQDDHNVDVRPLYRRLLGLAPQLHFCEAI